MSSVLKAAGWPFRLLARVLPRLPSADESEPGARREQLLQGADLIETCLLLLLFGSLVLKGFILHRDALYSYLGGFILFAFVCVRYRECLFSVSKTILAFGGLALFACASALWAHEAYLVFLDAREMVAALPAMIAIHQICRSEAGLKRVLFSLKAVLIASVCLSLAGGVYSYGNREFLLMNSSVITPFMLMSFVIVFIEWQSRRKCGFCIVALMVAIIPMLIVSSVRSVVVILAILGTYLFILNAGTVIGRVLAAVGAAGLLFVVVVHGPTLMTALEGTRYFRHYSHMEAYLEEGALEGSVGFRLMVQDLALDMIAQRPIVGHGLNNSRHLYERWIGMRTYSHSGYAEILVGLGLVGMLLFLLMFAELSARFIRFWRINRRVSAAGISVLVGFLLFGFIGPLYTSVELLICLALLASPGLASMVSPLKKGWWARLTRSEERH